MPCTDGGVPYPPTPRELRQRKVPAMLCAVLGTMTSEQLEATLQRIDWKEAGVSREDLVQWWKDHQAEDMRRRAEARISASIEAVRATALRKLSSAELHALGLTRQGHRK